MLYEVHLEGTWSFPYADTPETFIKQIQEGVWPGQLVVMTEDYDPSEYDHSASGTFTFDIEGEARSGNHAMERAREMLTRVLADVLCELPNIEVL